MGEGEGEAELRDSSVDDMSSGREDVTYDEKTTPDEPVAESEKVVDDSWAVTKFDEILSTNLLSLELVELDSTNTDSSDTVDDEAVELAS